MKKKVFGAWFVSLSFYEKQEQMTLAPYFLYCQNSIPQKPPNPNFSDFFLKLGFYDIVRWIYVCEYLAFLPVGTSDEDTESFSVSEQGRTWKSDGSSFKSWFAAADKLCILGLVTQLLWALFSVICKNGLLRHILAELSWKLLEMKFPSTILGPWW